MKHRKYATKASYIAEEYTFDKPCDGLDAIDYLLRAIRIKNISDYTLVQYWDDNKGWVLGITNTYISVSIVYVEDPAVTIVNRRYKIHLQDIRLKNNAGMNFPVCHASAKLLDLDKSAWLTVGRNVYLNAPEGAKHLFCKHCIREWTKRYGDWAPLERS